LSAAVVVVVCDVVVCVVVVVFDVVVFDVVVFDVAVFVVFVVLCVLCVLCFVGLCWAFVLVVDDVLEVVTEALVVLDFELEPQAPRVSAAARTARTVVTPVFTVRQLTERRVRQ
jgi:hypothetical protein